MPRQDDIKELIVAHTRRKHQLEMQRALAGYSVDPKVSLEIEDIEKEIEELLVELKGLDEEIDLPHSITVKKVDSLTLNLLSEISNAFLAFSYDPGELLGKFYAWEQVISPQLNDNNRQRIKRLEETIDSIVEHGTGDFRRQDITREVRELVQNAI